MDEQEYTDFTPEEKCEAFDRIAACFLNQNFGVTSKNDLELIFFSVLLKHLQANQELYDDYTISNILGITQQRVRNLKIKNQLRNQYDYDWQAELVRLAKNARYSDDDRYIIISLDNPILMIEIQHFIEEKGGMVDFALNPKLLKMPTCDFAVLLIEIGMVENKKSVWELLRKTYQTENADAEAITAENWRKRVGKGTVGFAKDVIVGVTSDVLSKRLGL